MISRTLYYLILVRFLMFPTLHLGLLLTSLMSNMASVARMDIATPLLGLASPPAPGSHVLALRPLLAACLV